jgi:2-dehydropantoate 2-reductase
MQTLIVGVGALGGTIGARVLAAGHSVSLATRDASTADQIRAVGLTTLGVGGRGNVPVSQIAAIDAYKSPGSFDLILLATKAHDAMLIAPRLVELLTPTGFLLPIQNGGVPAMLAEQLGSRRVLGGLSNLGATMLEVGVFEQRNDGYLLIGELSGGPSERASQVEEWLNDSVRVRTTQNLRGAIWAKLLINCSVTTIGALAGCTMQEYIVREEGRALFEKAYDEVLKIALASGNVPERMIVEPVPPRGKGSVLEGKYEVWLQDVLKTYGALKPSMLQDIERNRITEIEFINGYVVESGKIHGVERPVNRSIVNCIRRITSGEERPGVANLTQILRDASRDELRLTLA